MSSWVIEQMERGQAHATTMKEGFDQVSRWLATSPRKAPGKAASPEMIKGFEFYQKHCLRCHSFASAGGSSATKGPDLTGYGDADWLRLMIMSPHDPNRYGRPIRPRGEMRNDMPLFRDTDDDVAWPVHERELILVQEQLLKQMLREEPEDPDELAQVKKFNEKVRREVAKATEVVHLTAIERELIIRFLLRDDRVVFGGRPVSGAKKK
jgi:mono/diheme cytochrome c family protein